MRKKLIKLVKFNLMRFVSASTYIIDPSLGLTNLISPFITNSRVTCVFHNLHNVSGLNESKTAILMYARHINLRFRRTTTGGGITKRAQLEARLTFIGKKIERT